MLKEADGDKEERQHVTHEIFNREKCSAEMWSSRETH